MKQARVLVVDDQPGMLRAVERVLSGAHQVFATTSPDEAIELARRHPPDLAVLDIRIPGMDGFELMSRLKKEHPALDVILMTGSATEPDQKLIRAIREKAFYFIQKPFDRDVLRTLVERCLEQRRLAEENRRHVTRMEDELAEARAFQQSLLPPMEAALGPLTIHARYAPCTEVGGDFCDYARADDGRVALVMADVSGHGASAAMLTALVKSLFRAAEDCGYDPAPLAERVSAAMQPFAPDRFVTLFCARLDPARGRLEYVNAGHPSPLHWGRRSQAALLKPTGPILSPALPARRWKAVSRELAGGDHLLLYTDGVTEAPAGEGFFGEPRLLEIVAGHPEGGPDLLEAILSEVRQALGRRPQPDDVTLLTARMESIGPVGP